MTDSDLVKFLPDVTYIKGNGEKFKYFILCKKPQQQKTQNKKKKKYPVCFLYSTK